MTDITELAQSNELLIANGNETANLLRHLANNEIDSDYFAVVSECEAYGQETDAELSITEFALRAAGYVDALVEALEKAQQQIQTHERAELTWMNALELPDDATRNDILPAIHAEKYTLRAANKRIGELESRTVTVKLPRAVSAGGQGYQEKVERILTAAGIKWEAE
ncbi:TPA: hypothetical protein QIY96_004055 [Klebsiella aerogenes]|nr:hypothetical protein [Klebsiella aerogenes]